MFDWLGKILSKKWGKASSEATPKAEPASVDIPIKEIVDVFRPLIQIQSVGDGTKNVIQSSIGRLREWMQIGGYGLNNPHFGPLMASLEEIENLIPANVTDLETAITVPRETIVTICNNLGIVDECGRNIQALDPENTFDFDDLVKIPFQPAAASGETYTTMGQKLHGVNDRIASLLQRHNIKPTRPAEYVIDLGGANPRR